MRRTDSLHDWRGPWFGPSRTTRVVELALRWLLLALAVWIAAEVVPGISVSGLAATLGVALILGLLNLYLRPVLVTLSLPITIVTLGLFLVIVNAVLLILTSWIAGQLDIDFHVDSLAAAVLGAIVISLFSFVIGRLVNPAAIARDLTK